MATTREQIREELKGGPKSSAELRDAVGASSALFHKAIRKLQDDGEATKAGKAGNGAYVYALVASAGSPAETTPTPTTEASEPSTRPLSVVDEKFRPVERKVIVPSLYDTLTVTRAEDVDGQAVIRVQRADGVVWDVVIDGTGVKI